MEFEINLAGAILREKVGFLDTVTVSYRPLCRLKIAYKSVAVATVANATTGATSLRRAFGTMAPVGEFRFVVTSGQWAFSDSKSYGK